MDGSGSAQRTELNALKAQIVSAQRIIVAGWVFNICDIGCAKLEAFGMPVRRRAQGASRLVRFRTVTEQRAVRYQTVPRIIFWLAQMISGWTRNGVTKLRPFFQPPHQRLMRDAQTCGGATDAAALGPQCLLDEAVFLKIERVELAFRGWRRK